MSLMFWRSVDLTGNQTDSDKERDAYLFWRSVDLTGNQTTPGGTRAAPRFGAVSI